jgi:hypothetical protein
MKLNARFYGESIEHAMSPRSYRGRHTAGAKAQRLSLNITKSVADTRVAMLTHDEIRISCVTTGADWDLREKAELAEQAIAGCFYESDFEVIEQQCCYDSAIFEPAWCRFFEDDSDPSNPRPRAERVYPWDIIYSEEESVAGKIQTLYYVPYMDKEILCEKYPLLAHKIRGANTSLVNDGGESAAGQNVGIDLCRVIYAWHLPRIKPDAGEEQHDDEEETGEEASDGQKVGGGRFVFQIGDVVMKDEEYAELYFPFEPLFAKIPTSGLKGISLVEELSPIQKDQNVVSQRIQRSIHLFGSPHLLVDRNSKVNTNHLDNQIGSIWEYSGKEPVVMVPPIASPEMYQRETVLGQKAYEIGGVSPQLAQGQLPAGLESGEAQRVHADIASARFRPTYKLLQDFRLRSARQFVRLMNRIVDKNDRFFVKPADHEIRDAIVWAEARMEDTDYSLRLAPTNQLADDPEGRDALIQDLINGAVIPQQDGMRLLGENRSDLNGYLKEQPWYSSYRYVQKSVTNILRGRAPLPVVGFMSLEGARMQAQAAYLDAAVGGCPEERLQALLDWLTSVEDKIQEATPPPAPQAPPAPGAAPAPAPGGPMSVAGHLAAPLSSPQG